MPNPESTALHVTHPERQRLLRTMIAYYDFMGYTDLLARLPGYKSPNIVEGRMQDHRPDAIVTLPNDKKQAVLCVVTEDDLENADEHMRWELFASGQPILNYALHFCVSSWGTRGGGDLPRKLRQILDRREINYVRMFTP